MEPDETEGNGLIEQQISQNKAEIEQKTQAIAKERLDIIKSQGQPKWTPEPLAAPLVTPDQQRASSTNEILKSRGATRGVNNGLL